MKFNLFSYHLNYFFKTYDKHRFNIKQTDPTEWIINNYVWPRTDTNVNIQQRLLNVKYLNEITANRISSSSDDSEFNINSRSVNKNQNLVSRIKRSTVIVQYKKILIFF